MLKALSCSRHFFIPWLFLAWIISLTCRTAWAKPSTLETSSAVNDSLIPAMLQSDLSQTDQPTIDSVQNVPSNDPLGSPHPIPWNWIMETYENFLRNPQKGTRYYRTPSLISPDGEFAAYSRIKMEATEEFYTSRATSVMFVENLNTRELRVINAASPLADNPLEHNESADQPGVIAILIPISWSANSDRVLARQFEGLFSTSEASDFAVIWHRQDNRTVTVAPSYTIPYTNAILLGWSETNPKNVLFEAGMIGEEDWNTWAVHPDGTTFIVREDEPKIYGQTVNQIWSGPQARW
jgi:hypothetical protein